MREPRTRRTGRRAVGRALITAAAAAAPVGAFAADWNETHIYNPSWPPHAKFHNAQTMLLAVALSGGSAVTLRWADAPALRRGALLASAYWITQIGSVFFPGTALQDPPARPEPRLVGVPVNQMTIASLALSLIAAGWAMAGCSSTPDSRGRVA